MQGLTTDGEVGYDRVGEVHSTLVALIKTKSKQFTTNIEKQVDTLTHPYKPHTPSHIFTHSYTPSKTLTHPYTSSHTLTHPYTHSRTLSPLTGVQLR